MPESKPCRPFHVDVHRHSCGERTYARITARITFDDRQFLDRLKNAITAWVRETKEGAAMWAYSAEDFNVGDFAACYLGPETPLGQRLAAAGIYDLEVEIHHSHQGVPDWNFDTVLVDECELEKNLAPMEA